MAQQLTIKFETAGVVIVIRAEEAPPARLFGHHFTAQATVRERIIADKVDSPNAGDRPLSDDKDEVDAILIQRLVLRFNRGREATGLAVKLENALHISLHPRCGKDSARRRLDFFAQLVVVQRPVAFEQDAVDDRVLNHAHDQIRAGFFKAGICEQAGGKQGLQRQVDPRRIEGIAGRNEQIRLNRAVFDTLIAFDSNLSNRFLRLRDRLDNRCSGYGQRARRHKGCSKYFTHRSLDPPW